MVLIENLPNRRVFSRTSPTSTAATQLNQGDPCEAFTPGIMGLSPGNNAAAELGELLSWFEEDGGSMTDISLEDLGGEMSLSLFTLQALSKGQLVMSIPISLCMTAESVRRARPQAAINDRGRKGNTMSLLSNGCCVGDLLA